MALTGRELPVGARVDRGDGGVGFWAAPSIQACTGGRWLIEPRDVGAALTVGVSTDTRTIKPGQVFVALQGERFDGHDFLSQAGAAGAAVLVVSEATKIGAVREAGVGVLYVQDTLAALWGMARSYRARLREGGTKVIAVTGSNGKTTTRHLIHAVLSARYMGSQSPKSYNNHIGVPLTLLAVVPGDRFVVVELGSNQPGEITSLGELVNPDAAVITNIGLAHTGRLGGRREIAAEKASLLKHVQTGGVAVVSGDEPLLGEYCGQLEEGVALVRFGCDEGNDLRLTGCKQDQSGLTFEVMPEDSGSDEAVDRFALPWLGRHNAVNALAAIAMGRWMGMGDRVIAGALAKAGGISMRLSVTHMGKGCEALTVINDAYNANPDSVIGAAETLCAYPVSAAVSEGLEDVGGGGRRVLVLGDMLELGQAGPGLHREVGRAIGRMGDAISVVVLIGPLSSHTAQGMASVRFGGVVHVLDSWNDTLPNRVASLLELGDVVLIKASRGMALERLVPAFERAAAGWSSRGRRDGTRTDLTTITTH